MHIAFDIAWNLTFGLIVIAYPFVAAFREQSSLKTIIVAWGVAVFFITFLSLGLPLMVGLFCRPLARELEIHWLPEGRFIVATALFAGWFYPLMAMLLGYWSKQFWNKFHKNQ